MGVAFSPLTLRGVIFFSVNTLKAGVNMKAVFWLGIMFLMQISCLRFKQSRISLLIPHMHLGGLLSTQEARLSRTRLSPRATLTLLSCLATSRVHIFNNYSMSARWI